MASPSLRYLTLPVSTCLEPKRRTNKQSKGVSIIWSKLYRHKRGLEHLTSLFEIFQELLKTNGHLFRNKYFIMCKNHGFYYLLFQWCGTYIILELYSLWNVPVNLNSTWLFWNSWYKDWQDSHKSLAQSGHFFKLQPYWAIHQSSVKANPFTQMRFGMRRELVTAERAKCNL